MAGMPEMQEHFPALQRAAARVARNAAPFQETVAAMTTGLSIGAGISCFADEVLLIDAGLALPRCNLLLLPPMKTAAPREEGGRRVQPSIRTLTRSPYPCCATRMAMQRRGT